MFTLPGEHEWAKSIQQKYQKGLQFIDQALSMGEQFFAIKDAKSPVDEKLYVGIQLGLFVSGHRTLYAIRLLSERGLAGDQAMILLRTLLEITTNSVSLSQGNKVENAQRYRDFALILETRLLKGASEYAGTKELKKGWEKLLSERQSHIDEIKKRRGEDEYKELRDNNTWREKNVYVLCEKIGMIDQYKLVYRRASKISHGMNVEDWICGDPQSPEIILDPGPSDSWLPDVLMSALTFYSNLLNVMDETLKADNAEEIKALFQQSDEFWKLTIAPNNT